MLDYVICVANAAARRALTRVTDEQRMGANDFLLTCLATVQYQLEKHRAPASAAQLQVGSCCAFPKAPRSIYPAVAWQAGLAREARPRTEAARHEQQMSTYAMWSVFSEICLFVSQCRMSRQVPCTRQIVQLSIV